MSVNTSTSVFNAIVYTRGFLFLTGHGSAIVCFFTSEVFLAVFTSN